MWLEVSVDQPPFMQRLNPQPNVCGHLVGERGGLARGVHEAAPYRLALQAENRGQ